MVCDAVTGSLVRRMLARLVRTADTRSSAVIHVAWAKSRTPTGRGSAAGVRASSALLSQPTTRDTAVSERSAFGPVWTGGAECMTTAPCTGDDGSQQSAFQRAQRESWRLGALVLCPCAQLGDYRTPGDRQ